MFLRYLWAHCVDPMAYLRSCMYTLLVDALDADRAENPLSDSDCNITIVEGHKSIFK